MQKTYRRGFTLIEILIVVAVLVVISGVYYGINRNDTPEEMAQKIIDPRSAAQNECLKQCSAIYGESESVPGNACKSACGAVVENKNSEYSGTLLAGISAPLLDFVKADYDAALNTDKLVVLYFYANWCPTCKAEVRDALYPAFNELTRDDVIGFRINFNDDETDAIEKALAKEFGVAYQHTKVFVKNKARILKSPESWNKDRYATEIENAI
ncbi:MAG: thioredoxin family protein [Patescibacteria group bacterium]